MVILLMISDRVKEYLVNAYSSIDKIQTHMLNKCKKKYGGIALLPYYIIVMISLLYCQYSPAANAYSLLSYNSVQHAERLKITATTEFTPSFSNISVQQYQKQHSFSTNSYLRYNNPTYGIAIQYPSNWKKIEYYDTPVTINGGNPIVNFLAPLANISDHWRTHIMIQVLKQDQAKTLVPQSQIIIGDREGFKSLHNSTMQIFDPDRNTQSTLNIKTVNPWVTGNNGNTYLLSYKAVMREFDDYKPILQKMIDSFSIEDSKFINNYHLIH